MATITFYDEMENLFIATHKDTFIKFCIRRDLPYLPADEANEKIIELTVKIIELQAQLDAGRIRE